MKKASNSVKILNKITVLPEGAIFIEDLNLLVISDLHLGAEGILAEQGIFLPFFQLEPMVKKLLSAKEKVNAENLLILGDLKHEFSETSYHEFVEVSDFLKIATEEFSKVYLVKGNHDNFIARVAKKFGIEPKESIALKQYLFVHGHRELPEIPATSEVVVLGHEHPAFSFLIGGERIKLKALIYSERTKPKIVVVPAFSELFTGNPLNFVPKDELLSPILRRFYDPHTFNAVLIAEDGLLEVPVALVERLAEGGIDF